MRTSEARRIAQSGGRLAGAMPRTATVELAYVPFPIEAFTSSGAAKEVITTSTGIKLEKINYQIDQPLEPILWTIHIPKITVKAANATVTFYLEDVTGAAQIIGEWTTEGITATTQAAPLTAQRRIIPSKDLTIEPELEGQRKWTLQVESSAETIKIPANTAKCVAFLKLDGLARQ